MARPRTEKVLDAKARLIARLRDGLHRPGDRFLSNRAIAQQFGVSYQTAHRLVTELCDEGLLVRRSASGTYLPGAAPATRLTVRLVFHRRARRKESFGARLFHQLAARLDRERIDWTASWVDDDVRAPSRLVPADVFPVIWESADVMDLCVARQRPALLLNQRPPSGLASVFLDSVSTDDFSGGAVAAQLLRQRSGGRRTGFAILSGPADDPRSTARVDGFCSELEATVIPSRNWFFDGGLEVAGDAVRSGPTGVFCCNDRLAEAVVAWCARRGVTRPPLVGFDDAPVSERLNLTTIAIPWSELIAGAAAVIRKRLGGDTTTASRQVFAPRPVVRG